MKYFVFSLDDGTIYDRDTIPLFNKYHVRATFNLNSGLDDFVWYYDNQIEIRRLILSQNVELYKGHEIASHSLTHPYLDSCTDEEIIRQVQEDVNNLENIFQDDIISFGVPFEYCEEREISLIKNNTKIKNIRLSELDESFKFPSDPYRIKTTTYDIDRGLYLIDKFIKDNEAELFLYSGHSYDFYVNNSWDKLEELLKIITSQKDIKIITVKELYQLLFE